MYYHVQAYCELIGFIQILNEAVIGKKMSDDLPASPVSVAIFTDMHK